MVSYSIQLELGCALYTRSRRKRKIGRKAYATTSHPANGLEDTRIVHYRTLPIGEPVTTGMPVLPMLTSSRAEHVWPTLTSAQISRVAARG